MAMTNPYPSGDGIVKWISTAWLGEHLNDRNLMILDIQPNVHDYIQGHIPGAVSLPWASLMDEKNKTLLKPEEVIRSMVKEKGATPEKTIICSCGKGREAPNEFILFKWLLKYQKVRIYEGSFTEWTSYKNNPTVVGKNPR